jgi:uncharacterized protein YjlB
MLYRDLVPSRAGGALIASHIRIPGGGPVPDYVHFHRVQFQLIVCLAGWVEVVYEGQGHPFVLRRGDFVTQPPMIRHRVLSSSEGLEVLEIGAPATHATLADHEHLLPSTSLTAADDGATLADAMANRLPNTTLFGGQRFVHSIYEEAMRAPAARVEDGIAWRESSVLAATEGLVHVAHGAALSMGEGAVLGTEGAAEGAQDGAVQLEGFAPPPDGSLARGGTGLAHDAAHLTIAFVTRGSATLACLERDSNEMRLDHLERADCATLPAGRPARWLKPTADFEVITVAFLKSEAAREAAARAAALEEVMQMDLYEQQP